MIRILRRFSNRLCCSYNIACLFYNVSISSNILSGRVYKNRGLLSVQVTTKIPVVKMCAQVSVKNANYEDIKALANRTDALLIDVREPSEIKETGVLPGSINIPLGQVENVLKNTSPDEFQNRYGRIKPDFNFPLVFSCRAGGRGAKASQTAIKLGYKDVTNYGGGWLDWEKHTKKTT